LGRRLTISAKALSDNLFPEHGGNPETLLRHADVAMYASKRNRTGWALYAEDRDQHILARMELRSELHRAIERDELVLCVRPAG
jgi:predicted signal transduction protein with EAL and GGDEF domain